MTGTIACARPLSPKPAPPSRPMTRPTTLHGGPAAWALPSTTTCDHGSVPAARQVSYGYDSLNRLTSTSFGRWQPRHWPWLHLRWAAQPGVVGLVVLDRRLQQPQAAHLRDAELCRQQLQRGVGALKRMATWLRSPTPMGWWLPSTQTPWAGPHRSRAMHLRSPTTRPGSWPAMCAGQRHHPLHQPDRARPAGAVARHRRGARTCTPTMPTPMSRPSPT